MSTALLTQPPASVHMKVHGLVLACLSPAWDAGFGLAQSQPRRQYWSEATYGTPLSYFSL